jgi:sugar lactone lactonase YvrE
MKISAKKQSGFILLGMVFVMVLMAVTAVGINRQAALQGRIGANQTYRSRLFLGQLAAVEHAGWKLKMEPGWRTAPDGQSVAYNAIPYNVKVIDAALPGYGDAVIVRVTAPDGYRALSASFRLSVESENQDIYIADTENHCIRKVDASNGTIATIAGTGGTAGFSGEKGPAVEALLNGPKGIWADVDGNIYIADTENHCIRKIDASGGKIDSVAGVGGTAGFSGDGRRAVTALLNKPQGVWVDADGNVYIADTENHCIRKVTAIGGLIATVAGTGGVSGFSGDGGSAAAAHLNKPRGIWGDADGNLYIADTDNHCIRKVTASTGIIATVAGTGGLAGYLGDGGPATEAKLNKPQGVCRYPSGNLYIADTENHCIRKVDASEGLIATVAGSGGAAGFSGDQGAATEAKLNKPGGLWVDAAGSIYVVDSDNHCIRKVAASNGIIESIAGTGGVSGFSGDGSSAAAALLNGPDSAGMLGGGLSTIRIERLPQLY